jgi:hypothetical protein
MSIILKYQSNTLDYRVIIHILEKSLDGGCLRSVLFDDEGDLGFYSELHFEVHSKAYVVWQWRTLIFKESVVRYTPILKWIHVNLLMLAVSPESDDSEMIKLRTTSFTVYECKTSVQCQGAYQKLSKRKV